MVNILEVGFIHAQLSDEKQGRPHADKIAIEAKLL